MGLGCYPWPAMKISLDWLNSYLDRPVVSDEAQRLLTDQGLPIESCEPIAGQGQTTSDVLLDVEVTSNRSDCLSHLGLAREVAAGAGRTATPPDEATQHPHHTGEGQGGEETDSVTSVRNEAPAACPVYTARVIRGVRVGPSPGWLVHRLESVGLRSVNNVADITNFVLLELGQPLHAFDLDRLAGRRVVVRAARDGESMAAIDGSQHRLRRDMLVIADAEQPVALAGIMGGMGSKVTDQTTEILLESAVFDPLSVRRTSRALKLASDSSYRFERGVDPLGVDRASRRAAQLICELAGGVLVPGVIRVGQPAPAPRAVSMRIDRCNQLLGVNLSAQQMVALFERIAFAPRLDAAQRSIRCTVPTYRLDVLREVDLIEEVARLAGFDAIPVLDRMPIVARPVQPEVAGRQALANIMVAHGYHEAVTFSFLSPKHAQPFVPPDHQPVQIEHERRRGEPVLRPSILPSLLACRKSNQDVGNTMVRLFECAQVWSQHKGQIVERSHLAMACDAPQTAQHALREVRGTIGELAQQLVGPTGLGFVPTPWPNCSTAAVIQLGGRQAGFMGVVAPDGLGLFDLQTPVVVAQLDLGMLLEAYPPTRSPGALPRFPGIDRDLSVVVAENVAWARIEEQVRATHPAMLEDIRFMGVYRGRPVASGFKSVSFRLRFRDPKTTLRHEQVDPQVAGVVDRLKLQLGAQLRG